MRFIKRRSLLNAGVFLVACFLALAFVEVLTRTFFPHSRDHVVPSGLLQIDETLGWRLAPGALKTHKTRYFRTEYKINEFGIRDKPRSIEKPPGRYRILIYGDSQIFGWGVPESDRFTNRLEQMLDDVEVWNMGTPGIGLGQEIIAYETEGLRYDADEVVFLVSPSTLFRLPFDYVYRKPKPRFVLDASGIPNLQPVKGGSRFISDALYRMVSRFYLPYLVERRLQELRLSIKGDDRGTRPDPRLDELARGILLRAKNKAEQQGQHVTLLVRLPDDSARKEAHEFADQNGFGYLDIIIDPEDIGLIFGVHDRHWNSEGNGVIAGQLYRQIQARQADTPTPLSSVSENGRD